MPTIVSGKTTYTCLIWSRSILQLAPTDAYGLFVALACLLLVGTSAVSAETNSTDVMALQAIKLSLFPSTKPAKTAYNWAAGTDACGHASCGIPACSASSIDSSSNYLSAATASLPGCSWSGLCCMNWTVTGVSFSHIAPQHRKASHSLPEALGWLQNLQVLEASQQG